VRSVSYVNWQSAQPSKLRVINSFSKVAESKLCTIVVHNTAQNSSDYPPPLTSGQSSQLRCCLFEAGGSCRPNRLISDQRHSISWLHFQSEKDCKATWKGEAGGTHVDNVGVQVIKSKQVEHTLLEKKILQCIHLEFLVNLDYSFKVSRPTDVQPPIWNQNKTAALCGMPAIQYSARSARLWSVHKLFTFCIRRGLVSRDSIFNDDWLPATEWCQHYLPCCQPASDVAENFPRFLVRCLKVRGMKQNWFHR